MLADIIATRTVNGWHENLMLGLQESLEMARRALAAGPENSTCLACAAFTYVLVGRRFEEGPAARRAGAGAAPQLGVRAHPRRRRLRQLRREREGAGAFRVGLAHEPAGPQGADLHRHVRGAFLRPPLRGMRRLGHGGPSARPQAPTSPAGTWRPRWRIWAASRRPRPRSREVLKHQPNSSLARSRLSSFRHEWMYDLYLDGLRKAGLPET